MAEQWTFKKGLVETGNGIYAYLQPDGGWGWSNAGLVTDGDQSLLVDTLFDAKLTREMLSTMADAANVKAADIGTVVNTHANGDHTHGNGLCTSAEIIASEASANEMVPASGLQQLMQGAADYGEVGQYFLDAFGSFDFADVAEKMPTKTFNGEMTVTVGDKTVELIEVGPAHTAGDVLVHVPGDSTVFTGDILFINGTPLMWNGPVSNWIRACERIVEMKPDVIVPGHGPITDIAGVKRVQEYLAYIDTEARKRFDDGMSVLDAALDIAITDYESWLDSERIAINVNTLYREYSGTEEAPNIIELFTMMAEVRRARG
ncbi:MAG: MBL fold metallo-hydrolase [bacterium]|nr:MBL fold metallo-hydrolase [Gammaproteobacteria bacterium]HIL96902.1 MBL fold metallo-hydrolase [Pseudomonadales bacterium]